MIFTVQLQIVSIIILKNDRSHCFTVDVDFTVNKTLHQFTYTANNTINSIPILFHSLNDSILERSETVVLEIRLVVTGRFIQIHNDVRYVTITILDNTGKTK